jgi:DNA-binding LacI/PurR family transcriptional regulator
MRVTIKDIAVAAGVTPSVVSAVLNGSKTVRFSKRKESEILSLVHTLGYRPNRAAQGLVRRKSRQIGILCYSPRDLFSARLVAEIQEQLSALGYNAIFGFWSSFKTAPGAFESVLSYPLDGLICKHEELWDMIPEGLPTVYCVQSCPGRCCVSVDFTTYFHDALEYLTGLGHRRIGFFSWNDKYLFNEFLKKADEFGLEVRPEYNPQGTGLYDRALELGRELFSRKEFPSALLCRNDIAAFAAINAAREFGIRIPEDLSIMGADNLDVAGYFNPPLTTFDIPVDTFVSTILKSLFSGAKPGEYRIKLSLIPRNTCAAPFHATGNEKQKKGRPS